jgi:hypothetical protein
MRNRLPGAARAIGAAKFSRELVEIFARAIVALLHRDLERGGIARGLGDFSRRGGEHGCEIVQHGRLREGVVAVLARPPVAHEAGLAELREVI